MFKALTLISDLLYINFLLLFVISQERLLSLLMNKVAIAEEDFYHEAIPEKG